MGSLGAEFRLEFCSHALHRNAQPTTVEASGQGARKHNIWATLFGGRSGRSTLLSHDQQNVHRRARLEGKDRPFRGNDRNACPNTSISELLCDHMCYTIYTT
jgi:hypothetical protein